MPLISTFARQGTFYLNLYVLMPKRLTYILLVFLFLGSCQDLDNPRCNDDTIVLEKLELTDYQKAWVGFENMETTFYGSDSLGSVIMLATRVEKDTGFYQQPECPNLDGSNLKASLRSTSDSLAIVFYSSERSSRLNVRVEEMSFYLYDARERIPFYGSDDSTNVTFHEQYVFRGRSYTDVIEASNLGSRITWVLIGQEEGVLAFKWRNAIFHPDN
jgi:hypothetical protein